MISGIKCCGSQNSSQDTSSFISIGGPNFQLYVTSISNLSNYWTSFTIYPCNESKYVKYSVFDTTFLEYINMINLTANENNFSERLKNDILTELDILFSEFPFEEFPELSLIRFEWDNATRLVLNYAPENIKLKLIKQLRDDFWNIYNKRINIHTSSIQEHEIENENELIEVEQKIVDIRDEILSKYYTPSERSRRLAQAFMQSRNYIQ